MRSDAGLVRPLKVFVFKELYDLGNFAVKMVDRRQSESARLLKENPNRVPVVLEKCETEAESRDPISILEENRYLSP